MVKHLREMGPIVICLKGRFSVFPSIRQTGLTSEEFTERLLIQHKAAVVPGKASGECGEGNIRCSYATSMEKTQGAMKRMKQFVDNL